MNLKEKFIVCKILKINKKFIIPCLLVDYIKDDCIRIKLLINHNDSTLLKKNQILKVHIDICRVIDNYGFPYYLDYFGEHLDDSYII